MIYCGGSYACLKEFINRVVTVEGILHRNASGEWYSLLEEDNRRLPIKNCTDETNKNGGIVFNSYAGEKVIAYDGQKVTMSGKEFYDTVHGQKPPNAQIIICPITIDKPEP